MKKKLLFIVLCLFLFPVSIFAEESGTVIGSQTSSMPIGTIISYAGIESDSELLNKGYLVADGSSVRRVDYPDLFAIIGTTYGSVDSSHFTLPNLKGRTIVGYNKDDGDFNTLGKTGGAKTVTLNVNQIPSHTHTFTGASVATSTESANHTHTFSGTTSSSGVHTHSIPSIETGVAGNSFSGFTANAGAVEVTNKAGLSILASGNHTHTFSGTTSGVSATHTHTVTAKGSNANTGGGQAHNNMQPYITLKYIIKAK